MGDTQNSSFKGFVITVSVALVGGVITLGVTFLKPAVEKKGAQLAGVASPSTPKPALAEATPKSESRVSVSLEAGPSPAVSTQPPPEPSAKKTRQPRSQNYDLNIPSFENTPQVEYLPAEASGEGTTRAIALAQALTECISKRTGSQVSAKVRTVLDALTVERNNKIDESISQGLRSEYENATDGLIRWWDIASEEDDGTTVRVKVAAVIAKINRDVSRNTTRKVIAVLPFRVDSNPEILGTSIQGEVLGKKIQEALLTYLVNSRKFAVVDKSFEAEVARLAGERPTTDPIQRAIEAARKLGADYVVVGAADGVGVTAKRLGNLDVPMPDGAINLRIIRVDTRQTMLASSAQVADLPELNMQGKHPENGIADAIGRTFSERSLEAIYPFKVAALNGPDEVVLNRGGDDVAVGQQFDIANPGEEIKDPATGESLGVSERLVGSVELTRVTPKTSYAKIVSKTEDIQVGAICRKPIAKKTIKPQAKSASSELNDIFK